MNYTFINTKLFSASEQEKILKQWTSFIKGGFKWKQFHKALYNYLHCYCHFIAHYSRRGFWCYYFDSGQEPLREFLRMFGEPPYLAAEMGVSWWYIDPEQRDISHAMVEVFEPLYPNFLAILDQAKPVMVATYPLTADLQAKLEQASQTPVQIPLI